VRLKVLLVEHVAVAVAVNVAAHVHVYITVFTRLSNRSVP